MLLPEPMEFIDLEAGTSMTLRVDSFQDGSTLIHPRTTTPRHVRMHMQQNALTEPPPAGTPIGVEVPALRLIGERLDQNSPMRYFDVSSKTLRADLLARFTSGLVLPAVITLTANGHKPKKRYSVEIAG
jgi:hypothetical protein